MMKKSMVLPLFLLLTLATQAQKDSEKSTQVFKKFKVDVSAGYAKPQASGTDGGALFAIEPKYALIDQLSLGLRMEVAVTVKIDKAGDDSKAKGNGSYLLTGDYYFNNNKFRPFGGVGAGLFTLASVDGNSNINSAADIPTSNKFGFMARTGFEYGHLRFGLEYNFVGDKSGYFGVKLGACIGGGRK